MPAVSNMLRGKQGHYRLVDQLASGGMAEIWLAQMEDNRGEQRTVVVKRILPRLAGETKFVEMFRDEAEITIRLHHPNLVRTYEVCQEGGEHFIVLEYLQGESLAYLMMRVLQQGARLPVHLAAAIIARVCDGLDYAHKVRDEKGQPMHVIHRDISPQNIIVLFSGGVKLVDFGVAKADSKIHETRTGVMRGKFAYMSPEQSLGKKMDARADIFSLGVVLWEVLAHRRLFKHDREMVTLQAIAYGEVPEVRTYRSAVPFDLDRIAMRALSKDPRERFQTAGEMGSALRNFLAGTGQRVDEPAVAEFCSQVMADRIREKQRMLADLDDSLAQHGSLAALYRSGEADALPLDEGSDEAGAAVEATSEMALPAPEGGLSGDDSDLEPVEESVLTELNPEAALGLPSLAGEGSGESTAVTQPTGSYPEVTPPVPAARGRSEDVTILEEPQQLVPTKTRRKPRLTPGKLGLWALVLIGLGWGGFLVVRAIHPGRQAVMPGPDDGVAEAPADPGPSGTDQNPQPPAGTDQEAVPRDGQDGSGVPEVDSRVGDVTPADPAVLRVVSRPAGCRLLVDGVRVPGTTPVSALEVVPDKTHEFEVHCPRHRKDSRRLSLRPGEKRTLLFKPRALRKRGKPTGILRLNTFPWTEVYLGKHKLGMTPLLGTKLPAGGHELRLINTEQGVDARLMIEIQAGKTTSLVKKYKPNK